MDLAKEAGDAVTIGIRSQLIGGRVDGRNKAKGNEGRVEFYDQRITIDNVRHVVKFEDVPMSQKRVGWDLLNQGREALVEKSRSPSKRTSSTPSVTPPRDGFADGTCTVRRTPTGMPRTPLRSRAWTTRTIS